MKGRKHNIPMCMALVLLCLTMLTTHLTGGLYARYTTTATGSDGAKVAKFKVSCNVAAVTGTTDKFSVTVTNESDVTVEYTLEVLGNVKDNTAQPVSLSAKIGEKPLSDSSLKWTLSPGETTAVPHTITLAPSAWNEITKYMSDNGGDLNVDFTVNVHAEQVD